MFDLQLLDILSDYRLELVAWVLCSILIYSLAVNVSHFLRRSSWNRLNRPLTALDRWPHRLWLHQVLRFTYYLGIPYLALTRGVTSPVLMGMWGTHWFQPPWAGELAMGALAGLGALLLLLWSWRHFLLITAGLDPEAQASPYPLQRRLLSVPWGWGLLLLDVLYLEMHWAFYRSAAIRSLGDYYGVLVGFLLILAEWSLDPRLRRDLSMTNRDGKTMTTVATAFAVGIVYYLTANLWLCMAVHLIIQFGLLSFLALNRQLVDQEGERN